ncbi:hypothetical protein F4604DRAFT_1931851 [Suillus subluteus]|nr:hypothetical protein F4604DRAFT_1931851 [Suillus subluteus]
MFYHILALNKRSQRSADALTLDNSTSATIFSNKEAAEKIISRLASLDDLTGSDGNITEPGIALFGRLYHMLRHHQYLNYYGQPEARLLQSHSMGRRHRKREPFPFTATLAMLCLPMLVREHLNQIYVDGLINSLDIKNFVDDFSSQNTAQITLAGVIMAVDAGFLAVQGVGTGMVAESILKGSIIFCVGCMFAGMFAQHFGEKLKTLRFAAYYLDQGMAVVIGVFSAPRFFCIMRQVKFWIIVPYFYSQKTYLSITWSSIGFLASAFIDAEHSKPALLTCVCCLLIVVGILAPLAWYGF